MKIIEVPFLWQLGLFLMTAFIFQASWNGGVASVFPRIPQIQYSQSLCLLVSVCILVKISSVLIQGFFVTIPESVPNQDDDSKPDDTTPPEPPNQQPA